MARVHSARLSGAADILTAMTLYSAHASSAACHMHTMRSRRCIGQAQSAGLVYLQKLCDLQHYLTMLGSTVLIPFLVVPPMGGALPFRPLCLSQGRDGNLLIALPWQTVMLGVLSGRHAASRQTLRRLSGVKAVVRLPVIAQGRLRTLQR